MHLSMVDDLEQAPRVLLVIEDMFLRKWFRHALEDEGCQVREAVSVERALARLDECSPELILLDLAMEHGTGLRFLRKTRDRSSRPPVLLVGVDPRDSVRKEATNLGALGPPSPLDSAESARRLSELLAYLMARRGRASKPMA